MVDLLRKTLEWGHARNLDRFALLPEGWMTLPSRPRNWQLLASQIRPDGLNQRINSDTADRDEAEPEDEVVGASRLE